MEKGKREGGRGERGRDACYKDPLLFISADAGVRKFLIDGAVMSNLLACILAYISVRDKHDEGIKKMCSPVYWHKLWKIKITPIM